MGVTGHEWEWQDTIESMCVASHDATIIPYMELHDY